MPATTVPLLYNQLRLDSFSYEYDVLSGPATGVFHATFKAWTTGGTQIMSYSDTTLAPDADPSTVLGSMRASATSHLTGLGYAIATDPTNYNP